MSYCPECETIMAPDTSGAEPFFQCIACATRVPFRREDRLLVSSAPGAPGLSELARGRDARGRAPARALRWHGPSEPPPEAARDVTNLRQDYPCPVCGARYTTALRLGTDQTVFRVCVCGWQKNVSAAGAGSEALEARAFGREAPAAARSRASGSGSGSGSGVDVDADR